MQCQESHTQTQESKTGTKKICHFSKLHTGQGKVRRGKNVLGCMSHALKNKCHSLQEGAKENESCSVHSHLRLRNECIRKEPFFGKKERNPPQNGHVTRGRSVRTVETGKSTEGEPDGTVVFCDLPAQNSFFSTFRWFSGQKISSCGGNWQQKMQNLDSHTP